MCEGIKICITCALKDSFSDRAFFNNNEIQKFFRFQKNHSVLEWKKIFFTHFSLQHVFLLFHVVVVVFSENLFNITSFIR